MDPLSHCTTIDNSTLTLNKHTVHSTRTTNAIHTLTPTNTQTHTNTQTYTPTYTQHQQNSVTAGNVCNLAKLNHS